MCNEETQAALTNCFWFSPIIMGEKISLAWLLAKLIVMGKRVSH